MPQVARIGFRSHHMEQVSRHWNRLWKLSFLHGEIACRLISSKHCSEPITSWQSDVFTDVQDGCRLFENADRHVSILRIKCEHFPGTFGKCTNSCSIRLRPERSTCRHKLCPGRLLSANHLYSQKAARLHSLLSFLKCSIRVESSSQTLYRIASFSHPKISPISARIQDFW